MTCYVVPTAVAVLSVAFRRKYAIHTKYAQWFTIIFAGGSIFGFVDHMWNGELFLVGPSFMGDMLLGLAITATLLTSWAAMVYADTRGTHNPSKN
jgi:hypothetical protein